MHFYSFFEGIDLDQIASNVLYNKSNVYHFGPKWSSYIMYREIEVF